jgi:hypothetical protein
MKTKRKTADDVVPPGYFFYLAAGVAVEYREPGGDWRGYLVPKDLYFARGVRDGEDYRFAHEGGELRVPAWMLGGPAVGRPVCHPERWV